MSSPKPKHEMISVPLALVDAYRSARFIVLRNGVGNYGMGITRDQWSSLAVRALELAEYVEHQAEDAS